MQTTLKHLPAGVHLDKWEDLTITETKTYYQQMIGTLIYATISTRPNIAFTVTQLSWYNNNPTELHIKYVRYILWYLLGTKELEIKYSGDSNAGLIWYLDLDWGENKDDHNSTLGNVFLVANGAISWALQHQKTVAILVGKAEYWN